MKDPKRGMTESEAAKRFTEALKDLVRIDPDLFDYFVDGLCYRRKDWIENRTRDLLTGEYKRWDVDKVVEDRWLR